MSNRQLIAHPLLQEEEPPVLEPLIILMHPFIDCARLRTKVAVLGIDVSWLLGVQLGHPPPKDLARGLVVWGGVCLEVL